MENNKNNITIGRPKSGGAIYFAPAGTSLPTDADTSLAEAYVNLGYITEDGVTKSVAEETSEVVAWGPETVMISQNGYGINLTFNLLESIRVSALQYVYGSDNVTVGADGSIKVADTGDQLPRGVIVVDTIQANGTTPRIHRMVFGDCQFVDRSGDIAFNNSDAVTYAVNVKAFKFDSQAKPGAKSYCDDFWSADEDVSA